MNATTDCIRARPRPRYDTYLREQGFEAPNPWEHWANSGADADGELQNGWLLVHADKAARVPEEHSETPYMTRRAMDFIKKRKVTGGRGACICPTSSRTGPISRHNPTPACTASDVQPAIRSEKERGSASGVRRLHGHALLPQHGARRGAGKVIPTYMGLIKQIDDQMGVLMRFLEGRGLLDTTMIVFTSDHGDYLGDHWMGEKDLFDDASAKIPLIVRPIRPPQPMPRGERCATRWSKRSIWRQLLSTISAASRRIIFSKGVR